MLHNISLANRVRVACYDAFDYDVLMANVAKLPSVRENPSSRQRSPYRTSWTGTSSFREAQRLARTGWTSAGSALRECESKLMEDPHIAECVREYAYQDVHDVSGSWVDVGAYLDNEPECMVDTHSVLDERERRSATLWINISSSCAVTTKTYRLRGTTAALVAAVLERMGYATEIVVFTCDNRVFTDETTTSTVRNCKREKPLNVARDDLVATRGELRLVTTLIRVKKANEPLDYGRLAFAVMHPSMLRRIVFAVHEQFDNLASGYGRPNTLKLEYLDPAERSTAILMGDGLCTGTDPGVEAAARLANEAVIRLEDGVLERFKTIE